MDMGRNAVCVPSFWMLGESWVVESTQGVDVGVYSEAQLSIPLHPPPLLRSDVSALQQV